MNFASPSPRPRFQLKASSKKRRTQYRRAGRLQGEERVGKLIHLSSAGAYGLNHERRFGLSLECGGGSIPYFARRMKLYKIVLPAAMVFAVVQVCLLQVGYGESLQTKYIEGPRDYYLRLA